MKFTELQTICENKFNTTKLADIANELGVTPQVVSNWKARNQVPYKYVKKLRTKLAENDAELKTFDIIHSDSENQDEDEIKIFIKNIISIFNIIIDNWKALIYFCSLSFSLSSVSSIPLGNPLKPVERISLSSPTIIHPTLVDGLSLIHI